MKHYSVLKKEAIKGLNIKDEGLYIDATLGYAGHSLEILKRIKRGFLFAFDRDSEAIKYSKELLKEYKNVDFIHANFKDLKKHITTKVDGIIFDLGVSSPQIDDKTRGFSFMEDYELDMRMNTDDKLTAKKIVNTYEERKLINIFFKYGEEKHSKSIARNIVLNRKEKEITTTKELVEIIKNSVPYVYFIKKHPERRIFQAIRIEVNDELNAIEEALNDAIDLLNKKGRLVVISFHSLEDRIVKNTFKKHSEVIKELKGLPNIPKEFLPKIKLINKKPIIASESELTENTRSKSAKLRIIERI